MPARILTYLHRHSTLNLRVLSAVLFVCLLGSLLNLDTGTAHAQLADWTTLERQGGGVGWDGTSAASAQTFVNVGGTGVEMTVSYSLNMRDGIPRIYGLDAPVPPLQTSLRWTGNPNNAGGAAGAADGPAAMQIVFSEPVIINSFTVGSLSWLPSPLRYEWIEVRAYDETNTLVVTDRLIASTHTPPDGVIVTLPDSPAIFEPVSGVYQGRGTNEQGGCAGCGYDRFTVEYVTTPITRIELSHFATAGLTADSALITNATSVAVEGFSLATPTYDFGDAPEGDGLSYRTTLAGGGPSHIVRTTIFMGASVDAEADGQPTAAADGDDANPVGGPNDENGIDPAALQLAEEQPAVIPVRVTNTTGRTATLFGWIDCDARRPARGPQRTDQRGGISGLRRGAGEQRDPNLRAFPPLLGRRGCIVHAACVRRRGGRLRRRDCAQTGLRLGRCARFVRDIRRR
jgi:hypothetical protein